MGVGGRDSDERRDMEGARGTHLADHNLTVIREALGGKKGQKGTKKDQTWTHGDKKPGQKIRTS